MAYRRFVSYIYEYSKGKKGENRGFVRVEVKNGVCRMGFWMEVGDLPEKNRIRVYGLVRKEKRLLGIPLGDMVSSSGEIRGQVNFPEQQVGKSPYRMDQMGGLLLSTEGGRQFATQWDDEPLRLEWLEQWNDESVPPQSVPGDERDAHAAEQRTGENGEKNREKKVGTESENRASSPGAADEIRKDATERENEKKPADTGQNTGKNRPAVGQYTEKDRTGATKNPVKAWFGEGKNTGNDRADVSQKMGKAWTGGGQSIGKGPHKEEKDPGVGRKEAVDDAGGNLSGSVENRGGKVSWKVENGRSLSGTENGGRECLSVEEACDKGQLSWSRQENSHENRQNMAEFLRKNRENLHKTDRDDRDRSPENSRNKNPSELPEAPEQPSGAVDWERIQKTCTHCQPFHDDQLTDCVKVTRQELWQLRKSGWQIDGSQFQNYGIDRYGHLLLCRDAVHPGVFYVGVPGVFSTNEQFMAGMFGYYHFRPAKPAAEGKNRPKFGYWCRRIQGPAMS